MSGYLSRQAKGYRRSGVSWPRIYLPDKDPTPARIVMDEIPVGADLRKAFPDGFLIPSIKKTNITDFELWVNDSYHFSTSVQKIFGDVRLDIRGTFRNRSINPDRSYDRSILGTYAATYLCGISLEHLKGSSNVHPIITSVMNFHVYFWTMSITKDKGILSSMNFDFTGLRLPAHKFLLDEDRLGKWHFNVFERDHLRYILPKSKGIKKLGREMLNVSAKAYTLMLTGPQVYTGFPVNLDHSEGDRTRRLAMAMIPRLVSRNFQGNEFAVESIDKGFLLYVNRANVRLDLAISPGVTKIPSDMVIGRRFLNRATGSEIATFKDHIGEGNVDQGIRDDPKREASSLVRDAPEVVQKKLDSESPEEDIGKEGRGLYSPWIIPLIGLPVVWGLLRYFRRKNVEDV